MNRLGSRRKLKKDAPVYAVTKMGQIIYVGDSYEVSMWLAVDQPRVALATRDKKPVFGQVRIRIATEEDLKLKGFCQSYAMYQAAHNKSIKNKELYRKIIATRDYNKYAGMPSRYKDASCVRFTPL